MEENPDRKSEDEKPEQTAADKNGKTATGAVFPVVYIPPLLVLAAAIAGGVYLYRGITQNTDQLSVISETTSAQQAQIRQQLTALDENVTRLAAQQDSLQQSLSKLYQQQPQTTEDWALSEIEYLLIIASHRLLLERDVNTALSAMEAAASRLQALDNPELIPVREQLTADVNRLRAVNKVDTPGLALYLADLIERADTLPVKGPAPVSSDNNAQKSADENPANAGGWRHYLAVAWQELKSLVVIKRADEVRQALLLPDEEYFLTQNLRLELENARLAVMRQDTANLQTSISLLIGWLNRYYDTSDAAVSNVIDTLQQMQSVELQPELPDISSSLETLRAHMRQQ